jgi:hypothetical protein
MVSTLHGFGLARQDPLQDGLGGSLEDRHFRDTLKHGNFDVESMSPRLTLRRLPE